MTRTTRLEPYCMPEETLAALDGEGPLLCLGGAGSRHVLVSMDFVEESFDAAQELGLWRDDSGRPWAPDRVVLASYSDFSDDGGAKSRAYRLLSGWIWDREVKAMWHFSQGPAISVQPPRAPVGAPGRAVLLNEPSDDYVDRAREAIADIRRGRFYQINLLRYFLATPPSQNDLLRSWSRRAGALGVYLQTPSLGLVSYSPERLAVVHSHADGLTVRAEPIKGTVAVGDDPSGRARARAFLKSSRKERAELAIITDLLRNDLFGIAHRHGVKVLARAEPVSAVGVEHMRAVVSAECPRDLTLGRLCRALLPGGSITGAPKREVMNAIRAYEGRPRDFFMGSVFVLDAGNGFLDASILIRTLVRKKGGSWEYAAGSGLTVASDPESEAAEIRAKCQVVTGL